MARLGLITNGRPCPVCSTTEFEHFADQRLNPARLTDFSYASRKLPEFMCLRLVRCGRCRLVYAPNPPAADVLDRLYALASFDAHAEAQCAAESYRKALFPHLARLGSRNCALDIGSGSGSLLPLLVKYGFHQVVGIEPSSAAIDAAPRDVRPLLRKSIFSRGAVEDLDPSLICAFMVLEHVPDPTVIMKTAYDILEPGGMVAVVVHNVDGVVNRVLGMRSPIIDIEHLQLFNRTSTCMLLENIGFRDIRIESIINSYPLRYWSRLTPLPASFKDALGKSLEKLGLGGLKMALPVGNMLAVGTKPLSEPT
jgi:SAM-dependent methyltransferase